MKTLHRTLAIVTMASFLMLVSLSNLFGQIQLEGLFSEGYGGAVWDANGLGPEPYGNGHGGVFYYAASYDYVSDDANGGAYLVDGMNGFPNFEQTISDLGYSAEDIVLKMGLCSMGDDVEGVDWFSLGDEDYCNFYPVNMTLELHGEPLIYAHSNYSVYYKTSPTSSWFIESSYMKVEKALNSPASVVASVIADAFMEDLDGLEIRFLIEAYSVDPGAYIGTNGRSGAIYNLTGSIEKGLPDFPIQSNYEDGEGFAGWDADGTGPEPFGDGHGSQHYYGASLDYDGISSEPGACLSHLLAGAEGFRNTLLQMQYRGYELGSAGETGDLKIKAGLCSLGPDVEGEDWGTGYNNYYGQLFTIELDGEPIVQLYADTNDLHSIGAGWESMASIARVEDISGSASADAQFVAQSFIKDVGSHFLKFSSDLVTFTGDYINGNGRNGGIYKIDDGSLLAVHEQATFIEGGSVEGIWTAEHSPYYITGELTIEENKQLLIKEGVRVAVRGPYALNLEGGIKAVGTPEENILFTASNPNINWDGIDIDAQNKGAIGSALFDHCIFQYGLAQGGDEFNSGGIFAIRDYDKLKILNSTFRFNRAVLPGSYSSCGGAISMWNCKPFIQKCIFHDNQSGDYGGAIFSYSHSEPVISNCLFFNNYSNKGGALGYYSYSNGTLINSTITQNEAVLGGAIHFYTTCEPEIINTILWDNEASSMGDQVYFSSGCAPDFVYCDIEGGEAGFQGAVFMGSYLFNLEEDPLLENANIAPYYIPSSASPVVNAGTPDTSLWYYPKFIPETCLCGTARVQNGCIDMGPYEVPSDLKTAVDDRSFADGFAISPNPVRNSARISYALEESADVRIETYTLSGQKMETLLNEHQLAGAHQLNYTASDLPAGIYLVKLYIGQKPYMIKMIKTN